MSALLVKQLKQNEEDFEFYPSTTEILTALYWDLLPQKREDSFEDNFFGVNKNITLLDIGAGNCKLLSVFKDIASSQPLLDEVYYEEIHRADEMMKKSVTTIKQFTNYGGRMDVVFADGEECNIDLHQFVLTLNNNPVENIDLSMLEQEDKKSSYVCNKEHLMNLLENYELPTRIRSSRENNVVKINKYMAIEKSQILINNMPEEVFVMGADFNEQTLLDKKADIIFSNPPYKEYSYWSEKIIKEANADSIYLVIPQRWDNQENIIQAIKKRNATYTIVGEFDFLNSEDRAARAKVNLLRIDLPDTASSKNVDPFNLWFNECFKFEAEESEDVNKYTYQKFDEVEKKRKETIQNQIVKAGDLVTALVELYNKELDKYLNNYKLISQLDVEVLKELNVKRDGLREALKVKIEGLKNLYWREIFDNLTEITSRLTTKSRDRMLETLKSNTSIDFTKSNIRSVVIWAIKNAPRYYDEQLLQVYKNLSNEENAKLYKSDHRFSSDTWRYYRDDDSKYKLDYRIVVSGYRSEWDDRDGKLSDAQMDYIRDLIVVARNLGFNVERGYSSLRLKDKYTITTVPSATPRKVGDKTFEGKIKEVYYHTNTPNKNGERVMEEDGVIYVYDKDLRHCFYQYKIGEEYYHHDGVSSDDDIFTTVLGHKNGNVHFQINQQFMKKFNLEAGRLRGWLKTPQEAAEELDISIEEASSYWKSNFTLIPENLPILLPQFKKVDEELSNENIEKLDIQSLDSLLLEDDEVVNDENTIDIDLKEDESLNYESILYERLILSLKEEVKKPSVWFNFHTAKSSDSDYINGHLGLTWDKIFKEDPKVSDDRTVVGYKIYKTKMKDQTPFVSASKKISLNISEINTFIDDSLSVSEAINKAKDLIENKFKDEEVILGSDYVSPNDCKQTSLFDFL